MADSASSAVIESLADKLSGFSESLSPDEREVLERFFLQPLQPDVEGFSAPSSNTPFAASSTRCRRDLFRSRAGPSAHSHRVRAVAVSPAERTSGPQSSTFVGSPGRGGATGGRPVAQGAAKANGPPYSHRHTFGTHTSSSMLPSGRQYSVIRSFRFLGRLDRWISGAPVGTGWFIKLKEYIGCSSLVIGRYGSAWGQEHVGI